MDLKKFKAIIRQSSTNSGSNGSRDERSQQHSNESRFKEELFLMSIRKDDLVMNYMKEKERRESLEMQTINNPDVEMEILKSIEESYFVVSNEKSEAVIAEQLVLEKLPQVLDINYLIEEKERLKRQLIVVSKKVSDLILQNQSSYATELERVTQLQSSLSDAIKVCTTGRNRLNCAKRDFTCVSLGIVASYRRREVLKGLLKSLQTIKTLQETDIRLRELLEEDEDYTGAIQLYLECHKVVSSLKHYNCISELNTKLQDTLEMTEEMIDVALSKMCLAFNKQLYVKLQCAYNLLGKTQTAMDQLLMHFASAIHNKAFSIVLGYVELFAINDTSANFHKRQYNELCKCLSDDCFLACLTDLCKALWDIMLNYYRILSFHREEEAQELIENDELLESGEGIEMSFNKRFVKQKLEHGLGRVWQDVQQKVRTLVQNHDLSNYKFDEFIQILGVAERMVQIGEEFCGNKSEDLQNSLHKQTINYFQTYHKNCMHELKEFLDIEIWTLLDVSHDFSLTDLQEFSFLKSNTPSRVILSPNSSPNKREKFAFYFSQQYLGQNNALVVTPFDAEYDNENYDNKQLNEGLNNSNDSSKYSEDNENDKLINYQKLLNGTILNECDPIVTNTTLNVLRSFGKYMHMMNILRPIAFDVLLCMFQLFDYYLFTVYKFFAKEMVELSDTSLSNELRITLKRIKDNLIIDEKANDPNHSLNKYECSTLSSVVDITSAERLFALGERIVAVESLVFLSNQFKCLKSNLESLIPHDKKSCLQQYFKQDVSIVCDLRKPTYMWVTVRCVQYEQIVSLMSQTQWNIKEIMSMHNNYVDKLLRELQIFSMRFTQICEKQLNGINKPKEVYNLLWENILRLSNRTFIEGFSQSKKCSNEGRALMQLDFQQFLTKVESLTTIRPIPEKELVEEFIKAYYLTEPALIDWIKTRKEYNPKQIIGLINCITIDNKKMKARLMSVVDLILNTQS